MEMRWKLRCQVEATHVPTDLGIRSERKGGTEKLVKVG